LTAAEHCTVAFVVRREAPQVCMSKNFDYVDYRYTVCRLWVCCTVRRL
jgi:hypothetical protein